MHPKPRVLALFTLIALVGLVLIGNALPATTPHYADAAHLEDDGAHLANDGAQMGDDGAQLGDDGAHLANAPEEVTAQQEQAGTQPTPIPPTTTATLLPTPTGTPSPTATPRPTHTPTVTPTPTPDMAILDARLADTPGLAEAVCQPDMALTVHEGQVIVPMLLYHFVGRETLEQDGRSTTRYNVTVADFDAQLALLHRLGYQTVTVGEVAAAITGTHTLPARPVAITMDDGWVEQYTVIFPLLQKYDMRATFYIPSSYPVGGRMVTWEQLQEIADAGMEIGSHTRKHVDLTTLNAKSASYELTASKAVLEEKLGVTVASISYPFGNYNGSVIALTEQAGYQAAVALGPSPKQGAFNRYYLNRFEIFGTRSLSEFLTYLPWRGQGTALCPTPEPVVRPIE